MKVFLVELEPVETRYTAQWKEHLPRQMRDAGLDVSNHRTRRCSTGYNSRCIFKLQWYKLLEK